MAAAAGHRSSQCHVLNFFFDKCDSCALTVIVNGVRFHIIADAPKMVAESGPGARLAREYCQLLAAVKQEDSSFTRPCSKENLRCRDRESNSLDSSSGTGDERNPGDERDSAVDVTSTTKRSVLMQQAQDDSDKGLKNWMLSPFGQIFNKHAPESARPGEMSLQEWYERPTMFFSLEIRDGELKVEEEEVSEDLEKRMIDIIPKMYVPKYIRNMDIPWYQPEDITVLEESDDPTPYHPTLVRVNQEIFFLKMVDQTQPSPTKREIVLMKKAERLGLRQKLRIPLVKGLVGFQDSKTEMMGFLQTAIQEPTPLTHLFDDEVPQRKRDKWAKESERMKKVLHENGIVWGDAKADNFMVDRDDHLWIIDFGGSYTAGWVDPELMETVEGDNMGVKRIVHALHDPSVKTGNRETGKTLPFQPEEDKAMIVPSAGKPVTRKRKANMAAYAGEEDDTVSETRPPNKRARKGATAKSRSMADEARDHEVDEPGEETYTNAVGNEDVEDEERYCICNKSSSGDMVGCDNDDCRRKWFHFECIGLDSAPKSKHWYCNECKEDSG